MSYPAPGPKKETQNDFWRMVWEQRSAVIVMLTRPVEGGKVGCGITTPVSHGRLVYRCAACLCDFNFSLIAHILSAGLYNRCVQWSAASRFACWASTFQQSLARRASVSGSFPDVFDCWLNFVYFKIASGKDNGSASCPKVELTFFLYLSSPGKACLKSSMSLQFQLTGSLYLYAGQVSAILAHTRELHIRTDPRANTWHWRSDGLQDPHILGTKGWFTLYPYY